MQNPHVQRHCSFAKSPAFQQTAQLPAFDPPRPDTMLLTSFLISLIWLMLIVISLLDNLSSQAKWLPYLGRWTTVAMSCCMASSFTALGERISEASKAWFSFAWSLASIGTCRKPRLEHGSAQKRGGTAALPGEQTLPVASTGLQITQNRCFTQDMPGKHRITVRVWRQLRVLQGLRTIRCCQLLSGVSSTHVICEKGVGSLSSLSISTCVSATRVQCQKYINANLFFGNLG